MLVLDASGVVVDFGVASEDNEEVDADGDAVGFVFAADALDKNPDEKPERKSVLCDFGVGLTEDKVAEVATAAVAVTGLDAGGGVLTSGAGAEVAEGFFVFLDSRSSLVEGV